MPQIAQKENPEKNFSLVLGGPLYQLLLRTHMVSPPTGLLYRRIVAAVVITWVPLAFITALEGTLYSGTKVPFLSDLGNLRFLIMLPLLIAAELIVHRRIAGVVQQFEERRLIAHEEQTQFLRIQDRAMMLRNSILAEVLLLVLSFTLGHWAWTQYGSLHVSAWYASPGEGSLSCAGYWYVFISLPMVRFFLLRWYFRVFIWYMFLWRVSGLHLQLNPLHPDRAGGLGFLSHSIAALTPVLFAQSFFLATQIANEILHEGAELAQFQIFIGCFILFLIIQALAPLSFFVFQLAEARIAGLREYGRVASRYAGDFREKWLLTPERSELLGTSDIQSLADLANSFDVVRTMRLFPFDKRTVLRLALTLAIPLLPLALSMFSVKEIVERLIQLLM